MKKRWIALTAAFCLLTALALPAAADDIGVVTPAEHDDIMEVLMDGAPYMSIDASQPVVKFQVTEELRGVGALQVYDYRHGIKTMLNNVEDVTPDEEGYVEIVLPSTGEFCIGKVPFTDAYRLTLDLRYLDPSMWKSAKTPDEPFDTDTFIIPAGDWQSSKAWREAEGLDPWPSVTDEAEEPEEEEVSSQPEAPEYQPQPEGEHGQIEIIPEGSHGEPEFPKAERPFPWGSYVVVAVSVILGVFLVNTLRAK